jgi:hypothetical protein
MSGLNVHMDPILGGAIRASGPITSVSILIWLRACVTHWLLTVEVWVQFQVGFVVNKASLVQVFLRALQFFAAACHFSSVPYPSVKVVYQDTRSLPSCIFISTNDSDTSSGFRHCKYFIVVNGLFM